MMLKLLAFAAGLSTWIFLHTAWWIALAVAITTYVVFKPEEGSPVVIQTIDLATGKTVLQPSDRHAAKYLSTRNDNQ